MKKSATIEAPPNNFAANLFDCMAERKDDDVSLEDDEKEDSTQITPQWVLNSLSSYTIRKKGAYTQVKCICGICYAKYNIGDRIICLPCQHTFHYYCIDNWLKWVKPSCPIDKKSVIHRQYTEDVVKGRRNRLSESYTLNEIFLNEECFLSSDDERDDLDARTYKKISENKTFLNEECLSSSDDERDDLDARTYQKISENEQGHIKKQFGLPQESTRKRISSLEQNQDDHVKIFDAGLIVIPPTIQQLKESVDTIRQSIRSKEEPKRKKCDENFQETLDCITTTLFNAKIQSPEFISDDSANRFPFKTSNDPNENSSVAKYTRRTFPEESESKFETLSPRRIVGKRNLTFGDLSKGEDERSSGWIFKRSNPINFGNDSPTKTPRLLKGEIVKKNISHGRTDQKVNVHDKMHQNLFSEFSRECTKKTSSFLNFKQDATLNATSSNPAVQKHEDDLIQNFGNRESAIVSPKFKKKLQLSIGTIQKKLKENVFSKNKRNFK